MIFFKINIRVVIYIVFTTILLVSCSDSSESKKKDRQTTIVKKKELKSTYYSFDNPPVFRKDGELVFLDTTSFEEKAKLDIEIASSDYQTQLGLMYRSEMAENQGMLFIFNVERMQSFWMRNTLIPLDILYINSKKIIVDIVQAKDTLSDTSYPSSSPSIYVLEVNLGYCERNNINIGDKIVF